MKHFIAMLLTLALLGMLSACGGGSVPVGSPTQDPDPIRTVDPIVSPTDSPEPSGLPAAEALPESCRLYAAAVARSGAAERFSGESLPDAPRAYEGAGESFSIHLPGGGDVDLILVGALGEGVCLKDLDSGLTQEAGYGQIVWNGLQYHAFTVTADHCAVPNLYPDSGGLLRLNIIGDCTLTGGEYDCLEGFGCVLLTGSGTLTVDRAIACGGSDFDLPALLVDGGVTLVCPRLDLRPNEGAEAPALAVLGGAAYTEQLELNGGDAVNAGGTLLARQVEGAAHLVLRDGVTLMDELADASTVILSGGTGCLAGELPAGTVVEAGAGSLTAAELSGAEVRGGDGLVLWAESVGSPYCNTVYAEEWAAGPGLAWDGLTLRETEGRYFAGTLNLKDSRADGLEAWGGLWLTLSGDSVLAGPVAGTSLLLTGPGALTAERLNIWGWGGVRAPLLAVTDGAQVTLTGEEGVAVGGNAGEAGLLLVDSGTLICGGGLWMQSGTLAVREGTLTVGGPCAVERGRVEITGGTVTLAQGLWLGEGDIVLTGGTVIVPGGLDGLVAENGSVIVDGGSVREP